MFPFRKRTPINSHQLYVTRSQLLCALDQFNKYDQLLLHDSPPEDIAKQGSIAVLASRNARKAMKDCERRMNRYQWSIRS